MSKDILVVLESCEGQCSEDIKISCDDFLNLYVLRGSCCSLSNISDGGCRVQVGAGNCYWYPKCGYCPPRIMSDPTSEWQDIKCAVQYESQEGYECPASKYPTDWSILPVEGPWNDCPHNTAAPSPQPFAPEDPEYELSTGTKVQVFLLSSIILFSLCLLNRGYLRSNRELQALRRQQQERRQQVVQEQEEEMQIHRKQLLMQKFHFTNIPEEEEEGSKSSSNNEASSFLFQQKADAAKSPSQSDDGGDGLEVLDIEQSTDAKEDGPESSKNVSENADKNDTELVENLQEAEGTTANANSGIESSNAPTTSSTTSTPSTEVRSGSIFSSGFWRKTNSSSNHECSICLDHYRCGDVLCVSKQPTCNHIFHHECIAEWLKKRDHCPLCRVDLMSTTS